MNTWDEILYKRTKTGEIQFWQIQVVAYDSDEQAAFIRKKSGRLGTDKPLIHEEKISVGKQKRSYWAQAESQAASDWKKKQDEGYKSLSDMDIVDHGSYVSHAGQDLSLEEMLGTILPEFNTSATGDAMPMLANDWAHGKKAKYPCIVQPKFDGVRCLMKVISTSSMPVIKFLSRKGKEYTTLSHIANQVSMAVSSTSYAGTKKFILDGEIYSDELTFQEIAQAVKKQYPNSLKLQYRVYDIVNDDRQTDRLDTATMLVGILQCPAIHMTTPRWAIDKGEVLWIHNDCVSAGYEGAMIRHLNGRYASGQRSNDLLKVKEFDETEFLLHSFEKGQRDEDLIAVCETAEGKKFKAKMVGKVIEKKAIWEDWLADMETKRNITIKHQGYTDDGLPRFPIGKAIRDYE